MIVKAIDLERKEPVMHQEELQRLGDFFCKKYLGNVESIPVEFVDPATDEEFEDESIKKKEFRLSDSTFSVLHFTENSEWDKDMTLDEERKYENDVLKKRKCYEPLLDKDVDDENPLWHEYNMDPMFHPIVKLQINSKINSEAVVVNEVLSQLVYYATWLENGPVYEDDDTYNIYKEKLSELNVNHNMNYEDYDDESGEIDMQCENDMLGYLDEFRAKE